MKINSVGLSYASGNHVIFIILLTYIHVEEIESQRLSIYSLLWPQDHAY